MASKRLVSLTVFSLVACSTGPVLTPPSGSAAPFALPLGRSSLWTVVSSPNVSPGSGIYGDVLKSVSGASNNDVWAVGDDCCYPHGTQEYYHGLFERWNGHAWAIVPYAANEPADTYLYGVSARSHDDAWAVGNAPYPNNQAVFEHWNGRKWKMVGSPYIANNGWMKSVVAISRNNAWAAGEGNFAAVLEHWDGSTWQFYPAYTQGLTVLESVAASGPNDVWAVGEFLDPIVGLFTEHFDGTRWTYEQPVNNFVYSEFLGVTALSPTNAWAVGLEEPSQQSQVPQTLIEHWDGSKWSVVRSPNKNPNGPYNLNNTLYSVAAISPNDIWAVGFWTSPGSGPLRGLFLHWNGKAWRIEPGPPSLESKQNTTESQLYGVTSLGSGQLWAVGTRSLPSACCSGTLTVRSDVKH